VARIRALRETYPRWGKAKLAVLLCGDGWRVSASTVGRTLHRLRRLGHLHEPAVVTAQRRRRRTRRPYARRKPWAYVPHAPGDLVQLDTMVVEVLPGRRRVHFTARDVISRMDVLALDSHGAYLQDGALAVAEKSGSGEQAQEGQQEPYPADSASGHRIGDSRWKYSKVPANHGLDVDFLSANLLQ